MFWFLTVNAVNENSMKDVDQQNISCGEGCTKYELFAILEHMGGKKTSGHYTARIRDSVMNGPNWKDWKTLLMMHQ